MNDDDLEMEAAMLAEMEKLLGGKANVSQDGALVFEFDPNAPGGLLHPQQKAEPKIVASDDDPSLSVRDRVLVQTISAALAIAGVYGYKAWRKKQAAQKNSK